MRLIPKIQFSLRSFLIGVTLLSAPLGWFAATYSAYLHEQRLIREIQAAERYHVLVLNSQRALGCAIGLSGVIRKEPSDAVSRLFAPWFPDQFERVQTISLFGADEIDEVLEIATGFPHLREVRIDGDCISAAAVEHFRQRRPLVEINWQQPEPVEIDPISQNADADPFAGWDPFK